MTEDEQIILETLRFLRRNPAIHRSGISQIDKAQAALDRMTSKPGESKTVDIESLRKEIEEQDYYSLCNIPDRRRG